MSPEPGQVYRHPDGLPMVYVRTEQRPNTDAPEHLFVCTRNRTVFQLWLDEVPPEYPLLIDTEGRKQANEHRFMFEVEHHNNALLVELLRTACAWLPQDRANELRRRYGQQAMRWEGE